MCYREVKGHYFISKIMNKILNFMEHIELHINRITISVKLLKVEKKCFVSRAITLREVNARTRHSFIK